ncbi:MAG: hypothetical protein CL930_11650 [Deltaproteobacteria bacterium]|nr:hypothetical protein [Deltaproteobacteria bacterium]MAY81425.1 hypothetical protein [Deltaproteobacteria bacterium]
MKLHCFLLSTLTIGCIVKDDADENPRCSGETIICTIAGTGDAGYNVQNQQALDTDLNNPNALALDGFGNLLINDARNFLIRSLKDDGVLESIVGKQNNTYAQEGPAIDSPLKDIADMTIGPDGMLYMVESQGQQILMVDLVSGELVVLAGSPGEPGYDETDVAVEDGHFDVLTGIAVADDGTIYIADAGSNLIRSISTDGILSTVAGADEAGFPLIDEGDPNRFSEPQKMELHDGVLYVADTGRHRIVTVDLDTGELTNVIGDTDVRGYMGDGGDWSEAKLDSPYGFTFGSGGRMVIADSGNDAIRAVLTDGTIDTVSGRGVRGYAGDEGEAEPASLYLPLDVIYAEDGDLIFADGGNAVVRRIDQPNW